MGASLTYSAGGSQVLDYGNRIATGVESMLRTFASQDIQLDVNGTIRFTYFTAPVSVTTTTTITKIDGVSAGTPTLAQIGFYTVDGSGNLTLVASTANNTSLWSVIGYRTQALQSAYSFQAGQRYAAAVIFSSASTAPYLAGLTFTASFPGTGTGTPAPLMSSVLTGQSSLPATISNASLISSGEIIWVAAQ